MPLDFFYHAFPFKAVIAHLPSPILSLSLFHPQFKTITNSNPPIMIKALKKLKNWSRKKKRRRSSIFQPPSSPPCCSCGAPPTPPPLQPTAPPLPPWLDFDFKQDTASGSASVSAFPTQHQFQPQSPDIASEITPLYVPQPLTIPTSYQQYLAPTPVYGVPVTPVSSARRAGGLFGCVASAGSYLIRCLCPCIQFHHQTLNWCLYWGGVFINKLNLFEDSGTNCLIKGSDRNWFLCNLHVDQLLKCSLPIHHQWAEWLDSTKWNCGNLRALAKAEIGSGISMG